MSSAGDRSEFSPPRDAGSWRALGLALFAHLLLMAALTWGINWKSSDPAVTFDAELWSSTPQQAAPRLIEQPPAPVTPPVPPIPTPVPVVTPPPAPEPRPIPAPVATKPLPKSEVKAAPPAPITPDVDIALEQKKKRKLLLQQKQAEELEEQKRLDKLEAALQAKKDKAKELEKEREREREREKEKELKTRQELAKRKAAEEAKKVAIDKAEALKAEALKADAKKAEALKAEAKKEAAREAANDLANKKQAEALAEKGRKEAMNRMMGLAGATGAADATGSAQKASGPSASYGGKVKAKVIPNVVFTEDIAGNPKAEVEVRTTPDGTIISQRLVKSSGNKAWDDAVIKAIIRTGTMPRDVDGRVPSPMILEFRPRD